MRPQVHSVLVVPEPYLADDTSNGEKSRCKKRRSQWQFVVVESDAERDTINGDRRLIMKNSSSVHALHAALERVTVGQTKIQLHQTEERASRFMSILSKLDHQEKRRIPDSHVDEHVCTPKSPLPALPKLSSSTSTKYEEKEVDEGISAVWHFESRTHGWRQLPKRICTRLDRHFTSGNKYSNFSYQGGRLKQ